jgi:hypothetical protein
MTRAKNTKMGIVLSDYATTTNTLWIADMAQVSFLLYDDTISDL